MRETVNLAALSKPLTATVAGQPLIIFADQNNSHVRKPVARNLIVVNTNVRKFVTQASVNLAKKIQIGFVSVHPATFQ